MTTHLRDFSSFNSLLLVIWLAIPSVVVAQDVDVIQVDFENSCDASVGPKFNHAVTLLHSFEYLETDRLFREILDEDPDCAMAHWGIAMSIWHPLWGRPSVADLDAGAAILAPTEKMSVTPREAIYLSAIGAFFSSSDPASHLARAVGYEKQMQKLYANYKEDSEAVVFYALSLLATADPSDKSYAHQYKAAGLLNWVYSSQPTHPGVLHYIIHSYDAPGLAHLALDAATVYADAAPDSAHAQHMPSHIFTRLGLWDRSMSSNHDSTASAADYTVRAHLPGHYDEGLHSIDYLMYAMLQTAHDDEALALLHRLRAIGKTNADNFKVAYTYAASPARYVLERHQWKEASEVTLEPESFPWQEFGWARSIIHFARGIGAARSDQLAAAHSELDSIRKIRLELGHEGLRYWRAQVSVQEHILAAWILNAEGDHEAALALSAAAADDEDAVDKHPVTPGEVLPARELYADMLLELKMHEDALAQYQRVLVVAPNRFNSLLGAARAAVGAGRSTDVSHYYVQLLQIADGGNSSRSSLAEARSYTADQ